MLKLPFCALALTAALGLALASPAAAQAPGGTSNPEAGGRAAPGSSGADPLNATVRTNTRAGRLGASTTPRRNRNAPAEAPTAEAVMASAQTIATAASSNCQVTEATLLGVNAEQQSIYEAACATGPGYILIGTTPPQAVDCVILAGQADLDRSRDPAADVGLQCKIPANTDVAKVVRAYALEAGIACTVDQGASIGKSTAGNFIYEVGCAEADGFWLEKSPTGWQTTTCMQVITQSAGCKFTQPAEQAATMKAMLAGSPAAACDVVEARYMGANSNGAFYEAKCGAEEGYIVRFNTERVVQQVYPCAEAARIGGGCKLTTVAAAAPAAPAPAAN
ncbi:hypothetical protein [Brevundimonas variabilis]|uniref:Uncharacterized protein n=1 Tax=Brevundimonas variabilis TaxID=74312 RepID=A0A7W9CJR1_9CAUL|nr:hypothetical protein [Brevundimonas variabilis]MBB5746462.1 hypothetical protein [Brevundimonas variabilis]